SAYLVERRKHHYLLVASVGFLDGVDGKVTIPLSEGLVGLVGEREEPINLSDAPSHPRYRYFPETGEERYSAFLGVPMIHQRKVVGILVIQQRQPRRFDEGEVAFLVTVSAQLASYIAHAKAGDAITHFTVTQSNLPSTLHGIPSAPGIAIGTAVLVLPADLDAVTDKEITDIPREIEYFEQALETTRADIRRLKGHLTKTLLPEEQNLFDAYLSMLDSRSIKEDIIALIEEG
ncbi:MAG TPA: phosphoenolpyruvate-utilizing N-terminal domain-containing protein, partial [Candidatus Berkiella sp.]|nr:phosphoenolpyruvate-utilizing N-terminal domain-containing protein [Candidatus Berkiella sp.]